MQASSTFVIAWSQTEIDGVQGLPVEALSTGSGWSWTGEAVCVDGPNDILVLRGAQGAQDLRARASQAAHRLLRRAAVDLDRMAAADPEDAEIERDFTVTDGAQLYRIALIDLPQSARPLLLFTGPVPPSGRELWVVSAPIAHRSRLIQRSDRVICFVKGTHLRTPTGHCKVEDLVAGDMLSTRDSGPQRVQWVGGRHLSGAWLAAHPHLRPIRLRNGSLGAGDPRGDLLVSPRHRVLVRGAAAQALFGTTEVLIEARDMLNDRTVTVDHTLRAVDYVHVLLPAHHVVWANGVATESFHPAHACLDDLSALDAQALEEVYPGVITRPATYGDTARRMLSAPEAAILLSQSRLAG